MKETNVAISKKSLNRFDHAARMYTAQLVLPGIVEPVPEDAWAQRRATRRFIAAANKQTAFTAKIARLAQRSAS
jgi:hypothetical protein